MLWFIEEFLCLRDDFFQWQLIGTTLLADAASVDVVETAIDGEAYDVDRAFPVLEAHGADDDPAEFHERIFPLKKGKK
jgi:hypothetical protein